MIAPRFQQFIHDQVAGRIGILPAGDDRFSVDIPLSFPDGDQCRAYVSRNADGKWTVTDGGATIMRASLASDVDILGRGHVDRFRQIVSLYGLSENNGELEASAETDVGEAVFQIAQAAIEIVHLSRLPKGREVTEQSAFATTLSSIVNAVVSASRSNASLTLNWHEQSYDPEGLYPVSYRLIPPKPSSVPLFVFGANSRNACMHATMSCLFHKQHKAKFRAVAIYKSEGAIPDAEVKRLNMEVEKVFPSIDEPDAITNFLSEAVQK